MHRAFQSENHSFTPDTSIHHCITIIINSNCISSNSNSNNNSVRQLNTTAIIIAAQRSET